MAEALYTIVVVDDAAEVRSLVRTRLRLSGRFDVVGEGGTGADAIALAHAHRPSLLLLDVSMPMMDGLEALPQILEVSPSTRVVMFSGFAEHGLAERARRLGATSFIEKSAALDELVGQLLALLTFEPTPSPAVSPAPASLGASIRTESAETAPELGEPLERFGEVFDNAAIGMATMTLSGQLVRANQALATLLGTSVDALVGNRYIGLTPAALLRLAALAAGNDPDGGGVIQLEHALGGGARPRQVLATISPVRDSRGRPLYLFLQVQDVTAQRITDEALRQSEERFRLLVDVVEDYAIFMLDPRGIVASWNAGAERIKGYRAPEIMGQHFRVFYPAELQAAGHPEYELDVALRDGHYQEEGWRIRKDGTRFWANVVITAIRNPAGAHVGFAKVTRDVTERLQMARERQDITTALAAANSELAQANRQLAQAVADQSQFLAVTAHELRSPIAVLSGSAKTLVEHWRALPDADRAETFEVMNLSAQRMSRLLSDLLTAARLEADSIEVRLRQTPLAELLLGCVTAARGAHPRAQVILEPSDPGVTVLADPERLAQAADNLIANAIRHGKPPIRIAITPGPDTVEIRFCDAGAGVADELRPRLFQRFATGPGRGGTGLGLFIVRELVRAQGGEAWYEPIDPGRRADSCFVLALPTKTG